jgi:uncharacterized membrane protein YfcA
MLSELDLLMVGLAGMAAGGINALAGGGTLITFPVLTAIGLPALAANMTNTVALFPGYLGATAAQSGNLRGQQARLWRVLPAAAGGGFLGGLLLLHTGEPFFRALVPYLILLASSLLAVQEKIRAGLMRRVGTAGSTASLEKWTALPVGLSAVYGGYFGAGLSVIILAVFGITLGDSLTRLNALKQAAALAANMAAATFFLFSGEVVWPAALAMAAGSLVGGALGGRLAGRIQPDALRWTVVGIGVSSAVVYWIR